MICILTGSIGHIGKPLAEIMIKNGHFVTVISSASERKNDIEALGAKAAIGSVDDASFLASAFAEADAVFCMIPPNFAERDQVAYYTRIGNNYAQAIRQSKAKRVVHLSSIGAHLYSGTGFITGSNRVENILDGLSGVSVTHVRPGYFYYNLINFIGIIKAAGFIGANYGGNERLAMSSPTDIAETISEALTSPSAQKLCYAASDDRTCSEVAQALGNAIGRSDLKWITLSSEQMQSGLEANGLPAYIAANLVELGHALHTGVLREDYDNNEPEHGKVKLEAFATEFAVAFNG